MIEGKDRFEADGVYAHRRAPVNAKGAENEG